MVPSLKGQVEVGAPWITNPVDPTPAPNVMARGSNVTVSSCVSLPIELVPATRLYPGDAGRAIDERYATAALRRGELQRPAAVGCFAPLPKPKIPPTIFYLSSVSVSTL